MLIVDEKRSDPATDSEAELRTPVYPGSAALRRALRGNIVCFPTQIPILLKQPCADMQWRMVLLFFVRGWTSASIASRFQVPKHRIRKSLNEWSFRALALGHVQIIDPEAFVECCEVEVEYGAEHDAAEARATERGRAPGGAGRLFRHATPAIATEAAGAADRADAREKSGGVVSALDAAIAHCDAWRGEFWMGLATVLRDMRAAAALEFSRPGGESSLSEGLHAREKERVYHAVA
jgi:hypothetical protein